ncbi:DUF3604 domain-containing protein [Parahaliea aestuarii]|uniref:DUF3604 domain-containing protein n=1 Tax=Parahaliea aestuarii TaxID=1852021 RepID=A0A5C9A5B7_9GAMM|nr:DUF3604 domain-containing protein [Parahaliea aestuarii]
MRDQAFPDQLLWGDTHLHTNLSGDAFMSGTREFTPEVAYRFARGETVTSSTGVKAALRDPLDFLVVADHAEFIGLFAAAADGEPWFMETELGKRWHEFLKRGDVTSPFAEFQQTIVGRDKDPVTESTKKTMWQSIADTADAFNEPGRFTALIGYEWSSSPDFSNLHRVVVYRDDAETAGQMRPFSAVDSQNPEDLWRFLADYEAETGGRVLAIAHNGNLSNGLMFAPENFEGNPLSADYASARNRWEPLYEVTQIKGDGEAHPTLSPDDGFADYETWDTGNFPAGEGGGQPKEDWMLEYEYARPALKQGLLHEQNLGTNPFQFGLIGSTDAHTGLPAIAEDNFFGKFPESEPSDKRIGSNMEWLTWPNSMLAASGLAAVWATDNSREAIFDAMKRREVYATTGPRIGVRLFGGWDFTPNDLIRPDYHRAGYIRGVPMGGKLSDPPQGASPRFMLVASKASRGANLDRIQVIKGWLDGAGEVHEKVYDVALSDGRVVDATTGEAQPVKNTVDVDSATYSNEFGAVQLATVWQDPDFNPQERAFYYARVLEIPTPRWTAYDASHFGTEAPVDAEMVTQERAYTSPIWYNP